MLLQRKTIVWAIAAVILPQSMAHAEEAASAAPRPLIANVPATAAEAPADQSGGIVFHVRPSGLVYTLDRSTPAPPSDDFRFDLAPYYMAPATGIRFGSVVVPPRGGWSFSGRAGPVRWLTPISGEGDTVLRFGGRVPGQPRAPGMGLFNMSLHYEFE
jgi:hypothetical protein